MASNYYAYPYENANYSQSQQSFSNQDSSTAPQPSQSYYNSSQTQSRQQAATARLPTPESRSATTQYNGLHFPSAPVRQTTAKSHDVGPATSATRSGDTNGGGRGTSGVSGAGNATNYPLVASPLYQPSSRTHASQYRQRNDRTSSNRAPDRTGDALLATPGWSIATGSSSSGQTTSGAASTYYHYSHQKPDGTVQQSYYASQRTSTTPATAQSASLGAGYDQTATYSCSAPHPSATRHKVAPQIQSAQSYQQSPQSTAQAAYGRDYNSTPSSRTDPSTFATTYQPTLDYGKSYQDDTDQSQSFLHRAYTLPQTASTRDVTDSPDSYFPNTHSTESSYISFNQTSKPSASHLITYDRSSQGSERGSAAVASESTFNYPMSTSQPISVAASGFSQKPAIDTAPTTSNPKGEWQPVSQNSPTAKVLRRVKTPGPQAPGKSKASAALSTASPATLEQTAATTMASELPKQHTFYPPGTSHSGPSTHQNSNSTKAASQDQVTNDSVQASEFAAALDQLPSAKPSSPQIDKESMEQHMREMIEKMREYQSRDPTAFQQVWENVKRAAPGAAISKPVTPLPMPSAKNTPGANNLHQGTSKVAKPVKQKRLATRVTEGGGTRPSPGSANSQAQRTVWPASQKAVLSQKVSKFLRSLGQNCSESFVMGLLDYSPTFAEICQKLEAQGYTFERNKLALELLETSQTVEPSTDTTVASTAAPTTSTAERAASTTVAPESRSTEASTRHITPHSVAVPLPGSRIESLYEHSTSFVPTGPFDPTLTDSAIAKLQSRLKAPRELEPPSQRPPPPAPVATPPREPPAPPPPIRKPALPKPPSFDKKKALQRTTYDPKTIVHAVLLATGRHPHYEGLNNGLTILKRLHPYVFDNTVDLAQIPWDFYDPPPAPILGEERKNKGIILEEETRGRNRDPGPFALGVPRAEPSHSIPVVTNGKIRGKRGRPRGSRGIMRGSRGGRGDATGIVAINSPVSHTRSTGDDSTAANSHKYGAARTNIHSVNGGDGGGDGSSRKRKHGDSPHSSRPGDDSVWGNGRAQMAPVFNCQWENCSYELQNLDTLRRHLMKKHKVENNMGVLPCCWGDCGSLVLAESLCPETGKTTEQRRKRLNFGTGDAWDNHVLGEHLKTVKEELGEGMSIKTARLLSRESSAHSVEGRIRSMSRDRNGRSITPVITPAPFGYKFTPPPKFPSGSQFRLAHDFNNSLPDENKMLEDELARIERIGAGMESYGILQIPGMEYDNGKGYTMKVRKLTEDLSILPPHPKVKKENEGSANKNGKEKAL
ncbi:hypothetical protein ABW20_dc0106393 [Dactylellina cionopaga]|nr:hypothetical protein ABW20_dc0106393 [Dactylellina cionopaga]